MPSQVILDTSYLISLADSARKNHGVAKEYFKAAIGSETRLLVPTVVVAEFERKQPLSDLGLHNFVMLPFNFDDAQTAAELAKLVKPSDKERLSFSTDLKIIAHAVRTRSMAILTEDEKTMVKYVDSLRAAGRIECYAILLEEGFDPGRLKDPSSPGLKFNG